MHQAASVCEVPEICIVWTGTEPEKRSSMEQADVASCFPLYKPLVLRFYWQEETCF